MELFISNASDCPIYEQIAQQIKSNIISGELTGGDALPSIRLLAKELKISVITTKRAYEELEQDGFIYTVAGKGCFVAQRNMELIREEQLKRVEDTLSEAVKAAGACGISRDELMEMLRLLCEEELR